MYQEHKITINSKWTKTT